MYKWRISVPVPSNVMPDAVWGMYQSLFSNAGFSVTSFTRQFSAGMVYVTRVDFTVSHTKPSALTHFILRWPKLEFTVTELCS